MIAVLFEVIPPADRRQDYLDTAATLRPMLEGIDGFVSIERFTSLGQPDKILSLSFWHNAEAVDPWRRTAAHRRAQSAGRQSIFQDYRLRVAEVRRDYGLHARLEAPPDSRQFHEG